VGRSPGTHRMPGTWRLHGEIFGTFLRGVDGLFRRYGLAPAAAGALLRPVPHPPHAGLAASAVVVAEAPLSGQRAGRVPGGASAGRRDGPGRRASLPQPALDGVEEGVQLGGLGEDVRGDADPPGAAGAAEDRRGGPPAAGSRPSPTRAGRRPTPLRCAGLQDRKSGRSKGSLGAPDAPARVAQRCFGSVGPERARSFSDRAREDLLRCRPARRSFTTWPPSAGGRIADGGPGA
jgi:hypothetical protein